MKTILIGVMTLAGIFMACDRTSVPRDPPGQWILESYSAEKGYVLRKDGVTYRAKCDHLFYAPIVDDELSFMPGRGIDIEQNDYGDCTAILVYMHKPVPFRQGFGYPPDRLFFPKARDGSIGQGAVEFTIIEAK